jgi:hypothetical protein
MDTHERERFEQLIERWQTRILDLRGRQLDEIDSEDWTAVETTHSQISTMSNMIAELKTLLSKLPSRPAHRARILKWRSS